MYVSSIPIAVDQCLPRFEDDHQYYHKWAMLTNPKDITSGPKGYVKCNITVNAKGDPFKAHPETEGEEDIEGNLLMPIGGSTLRQRAQFIFTVYRADGLPTMNGLFRCQNDLENINPYVQISFAGMKGKTSEQHNIFAPQFNERIIFKEMFPPLCHRVRIAIKDRRSGCCSNVVATYILNLSKISNSGEYGFFPTFGPSFIQFYGSGKSGDCSCIGKCAATLPAHRGRVLLALKTEFSDPEGSSATGVEVESTAPVIEKSMWKTEEYILVGIIYDVCMIDRCRYTTKKISFEISLGNAGNRLLSYSQCVESSGDGLLERVTAEKSPDFESQTVPKATASMDHKYDYLPFGANKPCMYVKSWWPNLQWRSYNSNSLRHIITFLETELEKIENLVAVENRLSYETHNKLISKLTEYCESYLDILDSDRYDEDGGTTKLDRHRVNLCRQTIESILKMVKKNGSLSNNHYIKIAMIHAYKYLQKLRGLVDDKYQLRAHIFQGRFDPGMDTSGLSDPLIQVIFHGHTLSTRVIRRTLDPLWDQTLIFPPVYLHGTREHIKALPPKVVVEAFDIDMCGSKEFSGRGIATPIVKLNTETYSPPEFPPKLEWYKFKTQKHANGAILAAFELIETGEDDIIDVPINASTKGIIYNIPDDIKPVMTRHRLEVIFWGIRDMKRVNCIPVYRPRIIIECSGIYLKSEVMDNYKKFCNFEETHLIIDLDLPILDIYYPSITIMAYDSRGFGCFKYLGVNIIPTIYNFVRQLITEEDYQKDIGEETTIMKRLVEKRKSSVIIPLSNYYDPEKEETEGLMGYARITDKEEQSTFKRIILKMKQMFRFGKKLVQKEEQIIYGNDDDESYDWWNKYFASLQIYTTELEMVPEFESLQDRLTTFQLLKGKSTGNPTHDEKNVVGVFKGHISIYRWPHPQKKTCKTRSGRNAANGLCDDYPTPEPLKVLVRLYVIRGINLHPSDPLTGKSDPYLSIKLGKNHIKDVKNYVPNQLNPTFGKLFELDAIFPKDYLLTIQVWDFDATSADDMIGETKIDLENRFYSRHRSHCGISEKYTSDGYDSWRDRESPTQILEFLCNKNNLPLPEYRNNDVKIGKKIFPLIATLDGNDDIDKDECLALNVLHHWQEFPICGCTLVPEHVEQRPLFNTDRPGLEQGKLELWIDMFAVGDLPPKPAVNVIPKAPEDYELRVIIWNTEDVPLVDNQFLTGEQCSDIYVKGWIQYNDLQKTDVHYNSLTGEGNFNWRFVFHFTYLSAEQMMIIKKKLSVFAKDETSQKMPCKLNLQVWDNDHFSPDDFLGSLTIDLAKIPRGSANAKNCTMRLLHEESPTVSIFKAMRIKGWWPFRISKGNDTYVAAGKLEMEMILVSADEADESPVGKGRDPPEPINPPNRPDTSFSWFRNPWKACRFVVCKYYKWRIIGCCGFMLFAALVGCGIYAFPGYFVKRLIGA